MRIQGSYFDASSPPVLVDTVFEIIINAIIIKLIIMIIIRIIIIRLLLELLLLRIQLKLNTALLSTVRVFVRHRPDISHFSHI